MLREDHTRKAFSKVRKGLYIQLGEPEAREGGLEDKRVHRRGRILDMPKRLAKGFKTCFRTSLLREKLTKHRIPISSTLNFSYY